MHHVVISIFICCSHQSGFLSTTFTDQFSSPGRAINAACVCLHVCLSVWTTNMEVNDLQPDVWEAGLPWHYLGQVQRSRSYVQVHGHRMKKCSFSTTYSQAYFLATAVIPGVTELLLVVCRLLCAKVISATTREDFPVLHAIKHSSGNARWKCYNFVCYSWYDE